jgi:hypothetical protein
LIGQRRQELRQQIAMRAVQLEHLIAGLNAEFGRAAEALDQMPDLAVGQRARGELARIATRAHVAGAERDAAFDQRTRHARAAVLQLQAGDRAGAADGVDEAEMAFQMGRRFEAQLAMFGQTGCTMHAAELDDDHADAAFGTRTVERDLARRDLAVGAAELGRHRRHDDAIRQRHRAQLHRRKQMRVAHVGHRSAPPAR